MKIKNLFLLSIVLPILGFGIEVKAVGYGQTYEEAVKKALRNAIEQALGVSIYSQTYVKNAVLMKSLIEKYSRGGIKHYEVLSKQKEQGIYIVTLLADVKDNIIEDFFQNPAVQNFFQNLCFNKRRIGVYYIRATENDLPLNSLPAQTLLDLLKDRLAKYQFRVFVGEVPNKYIQDLEDAEIASQLARNDDLDAVVLVRFSKIIKPTPFGYRFAASITLKAFDVDSREFFASTQKNSKPKLLRYMPSLDYLNRLAIQYGKTAVMELISKIVNRFESKGCRSTYILVLRGLDTEKVFDFEDWLDSQNINYRIQEEGNNQVVYELVSDLSLSSLRRKIYRALRKIGVRVRHIRIEGNTLEFSL
jgi:hypothetical protein